MTAHAAIAAVPKTGTPNRTLLQALLVSRFAWIVGAGESPADFDPRGEDGSPFTRVIGYNGLWFWYDEADATTGHDGVTCIVTTATGGRYKVTGVDLLVTSVISKTLTTPPDPDDVDEGLRPSNGDAYIVPAASTGDWATWTGSIAVWVAARREWFRILPKAGWYVSLPGATRDTVYRYDSVQSDWITGDGATASEDSIPISAIQGCAASLTVRVQNQTAYAPPGSRKTGATPTMPLGGTASNINDNDDTTTATTSAIGDKSAAAFADRIIAQLTLAATTDLISIEARGVLGSAVSSSNAMGLWYKSGGVWSQAGSGFTLSSTAQNIQRNGSFAAVTDIALVTEAKNWSTNTNTLAGLNAYDATVTGTIGDTYVIASPAIGVFAGHELKVARCEVANAYTIYTPELGDRVHDISLGIDIVWRGAAWVSAAGSIIGYDKIFATTAAYTPSSGPVSYYAYSSTGAPATSGVHANEDQTLTYTAKAGSRYLNFTLSARYVVSGDSYVVALMRDAESSALDWKGVVPVTNGEEFTFVLRTPVSDTLSHAYRIAYFPTSVASSLTLVLRRTLEVEEIV